MEYNKDSTITIANRDEFFIVNLDNVAYFKAEGHFTWVFYLNGTRMLVPSGLKKLHEKIRCTNKAADCFLPMGRSIIVNRHEICSLNSVKEIVTVCGSNGQLIPIHVSKSVLRTVIKEHFV